MKSSKQCPLSFTAGNTKEEETAYSKGQTDARLGVQPNFKQFLTNNERIWYKAGLKNA